MKKLFLSLMGAAALTLMLGACSQSKNADAAAQEGESTEATAAADKSKSAPLPLVLFKYNAGGCFFLHIRLLTILSGKIQSHLPFVKPKAS